MFEDLGRELWLGFHFSEENRKLEMRKVQVLPGLCSAKGLREFIMAAFTVTGAVWGNRSLKGGWLN